MKFSSVILGGIVTASTLVGVNSNPIPDRDLLLLQGYSIVPLTFTGPVGPNGRNVTFSGTVQEIHDQIIKINPSYYNQTAKAIDDVVVDHEKRGVYDIKCKVPYGGAKLKDIGKGIQHLKNSNGNCYVGAGPRVCARISCSWNSAIFLCNDSDESINPSCSRLATDYAQPIIDKCVGSGAFKVVGQTFDTDSFNVLVKGSKC